MNTQLLDTIPIFLVVGLFAIVTLACYEGGFRLGRWWQDRMPGTQEGPSGVLVGSLLALMAFLLAVTMGMAADRFDARRAIVLDEANAIGKAYLQAGYLPQEQADELRELLREYLPLRVTSRDSTLIQLSIQRSLEMHAEMWAIEEQVARSGYSPDLVASVGEALTDIVSVHESRVTAGLYARVPQTVLLLLLAGSVLSVGLVGYSAGVTRQRSILSALALVVALGAVMTLVIDLDRPQEGFLTVSQQPLLDVQVWIGRPLP